MVKLHYIINGKKKQTYDCCIKLTNDSENRLKVIVSCKAPNVICFNGTFSNNKVNVKKIL